MVQLILEAAQGAPSCECIWILAGGRNAANFLLATRFQLRPNDVIFVAEQPVTKWNRVITQITPSLINTAAAQSLN